MTSQPRDCDHCHRRIGARRTHYIATTTTGPVVVCVRCLGRGDHHRAYPDCPHQWHDMHDHGLSLATRAAVPWVLAAPPSLPVRTGPYRFRTTRTTRGAHP